MLYLNRLDIFKESGAIMIAMFSKYLLMLEI